MDYNLSTIFYHKLSHKFHISSIIYAEPTDSNGERVWLIFISPIFYL